MGTRTKTFDCVDMKRRAQERLRKEYEARRGEFSSFVDFINGTAEESPFVREMRERFGACRAGRRARDSG